jgi:acetoin utilization deacetylase AcuC-like enzyme
MVGDSYDRSGHTLAVRPRNRKEAAVADDTDAASLVAIALTYPVTPECDTCRRWRPTPSQGGPTNHTLPLFFSPDYLSSSTPFDTLQKPGWVAALLNTRPVPSVELIAPTPLTEADLEAVHDPVYVRAIRSGDDPRLVETTGFAWDAGLWTSVGASNGGAVAAALAALRSGTHAGSLSCGLHHARCDSGHGFCTFNGLALAARAAIDDGARRILVLDLDAHFGGGTARIVADWPEVTHLDVAVSAFDGYAPADRQTVRLVSCPEDYLPTIASLLEGATGSWDLVLYNAGMDPHEGSAIGGLRGVTTEMLAERERVVFAWARRRGVPVAFVLAGGYAGARLSRESLAGLHRLTISAASESSPVS